MQSKFQHSNDKASIGYINYGIISSRNISPTSLPTLNDPKIYSLYGNAYTFSQKGMSLQAFSTQIKTFHFNMTGSLIQSFNLCLWIVTIIFGSILIFPLFFICCNWWKKNTYQLYQVDIQGYQGLANIISRSNVKQLYVVVKDNYFDQIKANLIRQALRRSNILNFSFTNTAPQLDIEAGNYSNFLNYMKAIKGQIRYCQITWGNKFVL